MPNVKDALVHNLALQGHIFMHCSSMIHLSSAGNMGPSELALLVGITSLLACQLLWEMLWFGCEIHIFQGLCLSMLGPQLFEEGGELFGMGGLVGRRRHKG